MFEHIKIVLIETSHPGNIGSVARAMLTMGFTKLVLVNPKHFSLPEIYPLASGADCVLENATVVDDLAKAIGDCHYVVGTTARSREFPWPVLPVREFASDLVENHCDHRIAVLFGSERTGLRNEHLECCHTLLTIPTNPKFSSLNLAQAVQVVCYELRTNLLLKQDVFIENNVPTLATQEEVHKLFQQLQETCVQLEFLDPKVPRLLMRRMKRLIHRLSLEHEEVQILRGICTSIERQLQKQVRLIEDKSSS
jgi:tRNA (cytidine32/uridine32-2'-O)-methyltransferase